MFFIGQVELDRRLFPLAAADMAYIFMTDDRGADLTWDPDAGENAVVLQSYRNPPIKITDTKPGAPRNVERDALTKLTFVDEPSFATSAERSGWSEDQRTAYSKALRGCKIGGSPLFIQEDEIPNSDDWVLIAQLNSMTLPFLVNFGGDGVGYVFANNRCTEAKLVWQC
jgi:hypothetical protein